MRALMLAWSAIALVAGCRSDDEPRSAESVDDPCGADPVLVGESPTPSTRVATIRAVRAPLAKPSRENPALPEPLAEYLQNGFGVTRPDVGEDGGVVNELLPGAVSSATELDRRSIAFIAHLSDTQLVDDESPTRLMMFDAPAFPGAARPAESMIALATSAMHRTLSQITKNRRFDFEIVTGDCADNAQQNEIEWFVDLMDGKPGLHTDSGNDDDPVIGAGNDAKDPFNPVAAPAPWYFVFGNHDVAIQGNAVVDASWRPVATGTEPKNGARDYRLKGAPPTREEVPADPKRRPLVRGEIIQALQASKAGPGPSGHGFVAVGSTNKQDNYAADPVPGVPVRLIQLDTNDPYGGSQGTVLPETLADLESKLRAASGQLVILASHHSPTDIDVMKGLDGAPIAGAKSGADLDAIVAGYPNVVLWLTGHAHVNRVRAVKDPKGVNPGFYEVMTDAIADWPSQARAIEIVYVPKDSSLSIYLSMIDFEARTCLEDRFRKWSLVDVTSGWSPDGSGKLTDRNVELRRAAPVGVKLSGIGHAKIETETTLVGK